MKQLLILITLVSSTALHAQLQPDLDQFNKERNKITRNAMIVLGAWSTANLIYSGIATGQTSGSNKYFHQMNVMWGGINLGLAALGYVGSRNKPGASLSKTLKQQSGIEKTYMLNMGLDVAYIAGGGYLRERSKRNTKDHQKFKGYGESIMLQGAALLVLDAVLFAIHNRHGKKLYGIIDKIQLGATGNGLSVIAGL